MSNIYFDKCLEDYEAKRIDKQDLFLMVAKIVEQGKRDGRFGTLKEIRDLLRMCLMRESVRIIESTYKKELLGADE